MKMSDSSVEMNVANFLRLALPGVV